MARVGMYMCMSTVWQQVHVYCTDHIYWDAFKDCLGASGQHTAVRHLCSPPAPNMSSMFHVTRLSFQSLSRPSTVGTAPVTLCLSLNPFLQVLDPSGQVVDKQVKAGMASGAVQGGAPETVLLVMLGGITFTEISALRFLASRQDNNCRFLVLTTKIVNGRTLLDSFVDQSARNIPHKA